MSHQSTDLSSWPLKGLGEYFHCAPKENDILQICNQMDKDLKKIEELLSCLNNCFSIEKIPHETISLFHTGNFAHYYSQKSTTEKINFKPDKIQEFVESYRNFSDSLNQVEQNEKKMLFFLEKCNIKNDQCYTLLQRLNNLKISKISLLQHYNSLIFLPNRGSLKDAVKVSVFIPIKDSLNLIMNNTLVKVAIVTLISFSGLYLTYNYLRDNLNFSMAHLI